MKLLILRALGGGALASLAAVGCGDKHEPGGTQAGTGAGGVAASGGKGDNDVAGVGGAGVGGRGGRGGVGGRGEAGAVPDNCMRTSIGTCCTTTACFPPDKLPGGQKLVPSLAGRGADDDGGASLGCPTDIKASFCDLYLLEEETDGQCCYVRTTGNCCGRPFLVGGHARGATIRISTAWIGERIPTLDELDPTTRAELARAWLRDAQLEHASIASFARFTLQAMSFGAPADLIADSQRAGLDEVRHAQLCFALASRYGGESIGPGTLSMHGALSHQSLADVAEATVREGCVAETIAAFQARRQLELSRDPHVRDALEVIAEDELRHAELAWRFVHWAIEVGGLRVRNTVERAFHEALAQVGSEGPAGDLAIDAATWHDHGRLTPLEEYVCWKDAVRDVIEPCAGALLERGGLLS